MLGGLGLLNVAILFFILAIIAYVLGERGVAGLSMQIGKWLVIAFIIIAIVLILL